MGVVNLTAVVLDFVVGLRGALRRQKVRADEERSCTYFQPRATERERAVVQRRIHNLILEFQIREADAVSKASRTEVEPDHMLPGDVLVVVYGKPESERSQQRVLEVRVPVTRFGPVAEIVVHLADEIVLYELLAKTYPEP